MFSGPNRIGLRRPTKPSQVAKPSCQVLPVQQQQHAMLLLQSPNTSAPVHCIHDRDPAAKSPDKNTSNVPVLAGLRNELAQQTPLRRGQAGAARISCRSAWLFCKHGLAQGHQHSLSSSQIIHSDPPALPGERTMWAIDLDSRPLLASLPTPRSSSSSETVSLGGVFQAGLNNC